MPDIRLKSIVIISDAKRGIEVNILSQVIYAKYKMSIFISDTKPKTYVNL